MPKTRRNANSAYEPWFAILEAELRREEKQDRLHRDDRDALQDLPHQEHPFRQRSDGEAAVFSFFAVRDRDHSDREQPHGQEVQADQARQQERRVVVRVRVPGALDDHRNALRLGRSVDARLRDQERLARGLGRDLALRERDSC